MEVALWDSDVEQRVKAVLAGITNDVENAQETRHQLRRQFEEIWQRPPIDELEAVLRTRFTQERARALLFTPCMAREHVGFFPLLICSPPDGAPPEHPQHRVQIVSLSLLYMLHVHDPTFVVDFCHANGLVALARLLDEENLMLRAQAMESLLCLTGSEKLGWFDDPPSKEQQALHQRMLALTQTDIITHLLLNYQKTFPGGGLLSLQLLGFYLSWLRYFYCKDRVIRVSAKIISTLQAWSERNGLTAAETDFAKKLYSDFKRFPAKLTSEAEALSNETDDKTLADANGFTLNKEGGVVGAELCSEETSSPVALSALSGEVRNDLPLSLRAQGNAAFAEGDYEKSLELYSAAIEQIDEQDDDVQEIAKLYANRAAARMELQKRSHTDDFPHVESASDSLDDCNHAIKLCPDYVKARFRQIQLYMSLKKWDLADTSLQEALSLPLIDDSEQKVFKEMHRKVQFKRAANVEREREYHETFKSFLRRYEEKEATVDVKDKVDDPSRPVLTEAERDESPHVQQESNDTNKLQSKVLTSNSPCKGRTHKREGKEKSFITILKNGNQQESLEVVLQHVQDGTLKAAFADHLDEAGFETILQIIDTLLPARADEAYNLMSALASVNRFSLNLMFLSSSAKKRLDADFAIIRSIRGSDHLLEELQDRYSA